MHPDQSNFISTLRVNHCHADATFEHLFNFICRVALGMKNAVVLVRDDNFTAAAGIYPGHCHVGNASPRHRIGDGAENRNNRSAVHWPVGKKLNVVVLDACRFQGIFKRLLAALKQRNPEYIHDNNSHKREWMARKIVDCSPIKQRCLAATDFRQGYSRFQTIQ